MDEVATCTCLYMRELSMTGYDWRKHVDKVATTTRTYLYTFVLEGSAHGRNRHLHMPLHARS